MRANTLDLINVLETGLPKEVGLRATFRKTLPVFSLVSKPDSLGLTNTAWIDATVTSQGYIYRTTNLGNYLYAQVITDVNAAWPAWVNTGNQLYPGSRPAVDGDYLYFQVVGGNIYRWNVVTNVGGVIRNMPGACALAPINDRLYALWQRNAGSYELISMDNQECGQYVIYGLTSMPRIDAVSFGGKEYFYTMDRDAGRIIEIQHSGNAVAKKDSYGVGKAIIPIDAIDDVYGLKMGYASVIDGKVVVTGRLTRTSDDVPVSFDVYAFGPEYFSFGREMFIGNVELNGKMLRVGNDFVVLGAGWMYKAKATSLFGGASHPDLTITTSDFSNISLTEAETRSTNLSIDMDPSATHTAIAEGSDVELEMAYNDNYARLATCHVEADQTTTEEQGASRVVSGVGKSVKRLAQWSPDQGIYIPSQSKMHSNPASMTKVIRAAGMWESTDPEDPDAPVKLKDLNKLGVLYSTARASRGGAMRGKFFYPSDAYFKPLYGVVINYYRESAAEAAARLGVEVDELEDDMYGHNGIAALYSPYEHNGGPGVSLCLWKDSTLTKLTSFAIAIPADAWHWLQIEFIEGEIRVKYRPHTTATWTEIITYLYASTTAPWKRETLGRGAIVVKNIMPTKAGYPVSSSDDTVCVDDLSGWPTNGTLLIGTEQITYSDVSRNTPPAGSFSVNYAPASRIVPGVGTQGSLLAFYHGAPISTAVNEYAQYGAVVVDGTVSRTHRILKYLPGPGFYVETWVPNNGDYPPGWARNINDPAYGQWVLDGANALYLPEDPTRFFNIGQEPLPFAQTTVRLYIKPAFRGCQRGANGTAAVAHQGDPGAVIVTLHTNSSVLCSIAASFSQDEDISMEEALETIVRLAGGEATCKPLVDKVHTFTVAGPLYAQLRNPNFIASFDLPALNDGYGVGIAFGGSAGLGWQNGHPYSLTGCYYLEVERIGTYYYLSLYVASNNVYTLQERVAIRLYNFGGGVSGNVPVGTVKVSVQGDLFSVWLNGRYLHTFQNSTLPANTSIAFASRQANTSYRIHLSEMNDLLADIVVGTRGNGMSAISELLADRHILWRDEPDGSMYFYKTRQYQHTLPDIISAVSEVKSDNVVTRVRAEGLSISEIHDTDALARYGNIFATVNARHANSTGEARVEAQFVIDESCQGAMQKRYVMDVHPGMQPGDGFTFPDNLDYIMAIRSQSINIGFSGNGFICDMQCDAILFDVPEPPGTDPEPEPVPDAGTYNVQHDDPEMEYEGSVIHHANYVEIAHQNVLPVQKAKLTFYGNRLRVGYTGTVDTVTMAISIDGANPVYIGTNGASGAAVWQSAVLTTGWHTVQITNSTIYRYVYLNYLEYEVP